MIVFNQLILVIENNMKDFETIQDVFTNAGLSNPVIQCRNGEDALDYLFRRGKYLKPVDSPRPGIILLDQNLPGIDSYTVLKTIKHDNNLKKLPVILLSSKGSDRDTEEFYKAGADNNLHKPLYFKEFINAIQNLNDFSFEIIVLPKNDDTRHSMR